MRIGHSPQSDAKRCTKCGVLQPLEAFPPIRRGEARRQSWCRACFAAAGAAYYARNREREKARVIAQSAARRAETRQQIIRYLLAHPCVDCGERDVVVLEFDHRGEKIGDISTYANSGRSWARVRREIEKCDVRCANCHRRATARRTATRAPARIATQRRVMIQLPLDVVAQSRRCRVCTEVKPLSDFPVRSSRTGTRHHICFSCQREATAAWYAKKVDHPVRVQRARGGTSPVALAHGVFDYLIEHPCVDCGEPDPLVLDFDHRGDKVADVSTLVREQRSWEVIALEIAKCDVRCANCHRRKTVREMNGYRLQA